MSRSLKIVNLGVLSSLMISKPKDTTSKITVMKTKRSTKYLLQERGNNIVEEEIRRDI